MEDGQVVAIALNRGQEDFTDADRDVLAAIAGPLNNALRRGRRRHRARTAIAAADSYCLGELTDRELERQRNGFLADPLRHQCVDEPL